MGSQDKNEMEEIQRGLEAFLEKELDVIGSSQRPGQNSAPKPRPDQREQPVRKGVHYQEERRLQEPDPYSEEEHFRKDWRFQGPDSYPKEEPEPYQREPGSYREDLDLYQEEGKREAPVLDMIGSGRVTERPRRTEYGQRTGESRRDGYPQEAGNDRNRQPRPGKRDYSSTVEISGRGEYGHREEDFQEGEEFQGEENFSKQVRPVKISRGGTQGPYRTESDKRRGETEPYHPEREKKGRTKVPHQAEDCHRQTRHRKEGQYPQQEETSGGRKRSRKKAQQNQQEESPMRKEEQKMQKSSGKKSRRKKHRLRKFLIITALLFGLLGFGWYQLVGVMYAKMTYHEIDSVAHAPLKEEGVVNILLIGNDSRMNGEDGRSDAMILLSISSRTKKIYMTSLLRDIYVDIPGYQGNRLNAAYSFGGAELLMETIEKNFDIPVNRYVLVNFEAFANLVDAVDGIELELSTEEIEYVNGYLMEYNTLTGRPQGTDDMDPSQPGLVHLNGPQALAYCRNRYLGTDFGRTERQRKVLTAVIGKLPSHALTGAGDLINGLMPNLTTNLTRNECFRLSLMAGKLFTYEMVPDSIPQPGTYWNEDIRGMQVLGVDFDSNIKYLKEKIYGE